MQDLNANLLGINQPTKHEKSLRKVVPGRLERDRRLLQMLVVRGVLSQEEMEQAFEVVRKQGVDLEELLLDIYHVAKSDFGAVLSEYFGCPFVAYDERVVVNGTLLRNLRVEYLRKSAWLPIAQEGTAVEILRADPQDLEKDLDIQRAFPRKTVRVAVGLRRDIEQWLLAYSEQTTRGAIADNRRSRVPHGRGMPSLAEDPRTVG